LISLKDFLLAKSIKKYYEKSYESAKEAFKIINPLFFFTRNWNKLFKIKDSTILIIEKYMKIRTLELP